MIDDKKLKQLLKETQKKNFSIFTFTFTFEFFYSNIFWKNGLIDMVK